MILVHTAPNPAVIAFARELLEANGIATEVRNEHVGAAIGEIPWITSWPELWVKDEDEERARALLAEVSGESDEGQAAWTCPGCGESVDAVFAECWSCGSPRPA